MAHSHIEPAIGDGRRASEVRILIGTTYCHKPAGPPNQIGPKDHTIPVVFESLSRVCTAHLPESTLIGGPERAGRRVADSPIALAVPVPRPRPNLKVWNKGSCSSKGTFRDLETHQSQTAPHPNHPVAIVHHSKHEVTRFHVPPEEFFFHSFIRPEVTIRPH